jgi:type II secretory pathway component GspD/PulD (secretin)
VRFQADERTNSLVVHASRQHQDQIGRVLVLIDAPDKTSPQPIERQGQKQLVKAYRLKHANGEAVVDVLRSLFLVVNHRVAYARFAYDPRTHLLLAIASDKHQKQIARVLEVLDVQATAPKEEERNVEELRVVRIRHIDGEKLISRLRSSFVVVNHEKAETRFGFDARTQSLLIIAPEALQTKIRGMIEDLDRPTGRPGN